MAKKWEYDLADKLKQRKQSNMECYIANIQSVKPFKATILNGAFHLDGKNTRILRHAFEIESIGTITISRTENYLAKGRVDLEDWLKPGDEALVIADASGQRFFLIGALEEVI